MGFRNDPQAYSMPTLGKTVTKGMSAAMISQMSDLYGFSQGATNILGDEAKRVGETLVTAADQYQVFDVNNPYQVGARGFDSKGYANQQALATKTATTVFAGENAPMGPLLKTLNLIGR